MITNVPEWFLSVYIMVPLVADLSFALWASSRFTRIGGGRRFWFYTLILFHVYAAGFVLVVPRYRKLLVMPEKIVSIAFIVGIFLWFVPLFIWR